MTLARPAGIAAICALPFHFDLHALLDTWGYPAAVVGPMIEGEIFLSLLGLAAHRGHLNFAILWLLATFGALGGDLIYFSIGRRYGANVLARFAHFAPLIERAHQRIETNPTLAVVVLRFIYGMRIAGPLVVGTSQIPFMRYLALDAVGAVLWTGLWLTAGYAFGEVIQRSIGHIAHIEKEVFASLLAIVVVALLVRHFMRRPRPGRTNV
jgi:membrane protein DedA with SNARE-associated domain